MSRQPESILNRLSKFMGIMRKAGLPEHFYQRCINDATFREQIVGDIKARMQNKQVGTSMEQARRIMGESLIDPSAAQVYFGWLHQEALKLSRNVPYSAEHLKACASTHVLIADPGMSISAMVGHMVNSGGFAYRIFASTWWRTEVFAEEQRVPQWLLVPRILNEDLVGLNWSQQERYMKAGEVPFTAGQMFAAMYLYQKFAGEVLYSGHRVRCRVRDVRGNKPSVVLHSHKCLVPMIDRVNDQDWGDDLGIVFQQAA